MLKIIKNKIMKNMKFEYKVISIYDILNSNMNKELYLHKELQDILNAQAGEGWKFLNCINSTNLVFEREKKLDLV